jgi:hypothetical protein
MTTYVEFTPQTNEPFQFQATLDNSVYNVVISWNFFGARYFINIYDNNSALVVSRPLIGTPLGYDLLSITTTANIAVATTTTPHTYAVGSVVKLVISGVTPDNYNGTFLCNIMSPTQFSYLVDAQVDNATALGVANYNLSLTEGYFASTLVYSPDSQQFIITP